LSFFFCLFRESGFVTMVKGSVFLYFHRWVGLSDEEIPILPVRIWSQFPSPWTGPPTFFLTPKERFPGICAGAICSHSPFFFRSALIAFPLLVKPVAVFQFVLATEDRFRFLYRLWLFYCSPPVDIAIGAPAARDWVLAVSFPRPCKSQSKGNSPPSNLFGGLPVLVLSFALELKYD